MLTFDYIHIRGLDGSIKDWSTTLRAALRCLRPGGLVELSDIIFPRPIGSEWKRVINTLKAAGATFDLYHDSGASRELQGAGCEMVEENRTTFQVKPGERIYEGFDLLHGLAHQTVAIFAQGLNYESSAEQCQELLHRLDADTLHQGLTFDV
jgi:hypothetical protein